MDSTERMIRQTGGWQFDRSMGMSTAKNDAKRLKKTWNIDLTANWIVPMGYRRLALRRIDKCGYRRKWCHAL